MRAMPMTVMQLARACGLSRGAVLYYEAEGLLKPVRRSAGNYRLYGDRDLERLRRIREYRDAGLTIVDIRAIIDRPDGDAAGVLRRRFAALAVEAERLREHQRGIARLLGGLPGSKHDRRSEIMTKDKWVEVMRSAGFTDEQMHQWHRHFERTAPDDHQQFLEFLHVSPEEAKRIRAWSRGETKP